MISKSNFHEIIYSKKKFLTRHRKTGMICRFTIAVVTHAATISSRWENAVRILAAKREVVESPTSTCDRCV